MAKKKEAMERKESEVTREGPSESVEVPVITAEDILPDVEAKTTEDRIEEMAAGIPAPSISGVAVTPDKALAQYPLGTLSVPWKLLHKAGVEVSAVGARFTKDLNLKQLATAGSLLIRIDQGLNVCGKLSLGDYYNEVQRLFPKQGEQILGDIPEYKYHTLQLFGTVAARIPIQLRNPALTLSTYRDLSAMANDIEGQVKVTQLLESFRDGKVSDVEVMRVAASRPKVKKTQPDWNGGEGGKFGDNADVADQKAQAEYDRQAAKLNKGKITSQPGELIASGEEAGVQEGDSNVVDFPELSDQQPIQEILPPDAESIPLWLTHWQAGRLDYLREWYGRQPGNSEVTSQGILDVLMDEFAQLNDIELPGGESEE